MNRATRAEKGELSGSAAFQTGQGRREFAAGDRIVFLKNDRELGVKNGTLGTVNAAKTIQAGQEQQKRERVAAIRQKLEQQRERSRERGGRER